MRRLLLDTGIASDYVNFRHHVSTRIDDLGRAGNVAGICTPVLGELAAGAYMSDDPPRRWAHAKLRLRSLTVWPYDHEAALEFGRLRGELKRIGRSMQQIDVQVAAIAMTLPHCVVITKDRDFLAIPGLKLELWTP